MATFRISEVPLIGTSIVGEWMVIFYQYIALSRKRYKIGPVLLWNANRNFMRSVELCHFQRPLTHILRACHYLTLNISEMVQHTYKDKEVQL